MTNLAIANIIICSGAMFLGWYVLIRDLKIFNKNAKTPPADSWLVLVGTLGWSVALLMAINTQGTDLLQSDERVGLYGGNIFARALFLIYWVGELLKIKQHCKNHFKRMLIKKRQQLKAEAKS